MNEGQKKLEEKAEQTEEKDVYDEYGIDIHGKPFLTFGGLLKEAHNKGLINIATNLLKQEDEKNDTVIVQAICTLMHPTLKDKVIQCTALGDANKNNIRNDFLEPHKIRIAETRAIARALRFALGLGYPTKEEMVYDEKEGKEGFASVKQIKYIQDIMKKSAMFNTTVVNYLKDKKKNLDTITVNDADYLINEMPK